ncbi:hypothetical protein Pmani_005805 [Petrolisthes manimaculis]|uniref:LEM domain-containing protein n=1 Tax=Petrolisthes manimaculis TaxID=1843537 RepID=A0AAE1QAZ1_9EUCA|nr:hypothetical protein Pmani_005805 [Petrolisthes manimaculis]
MASLKSLTDQELRKKLKEHGIIAPVTASSRDILIKKLNHAIANEKRTSTSNNRARRTQNTSRLHTFSSDEDEDNDSSVYSQATRTSARMSSRSRGPATRTSAGDTSYSTRRSSSSRSGSGGGDKSRAGQVKSVHSGGGLIYSMTEAGQAGATVGQVRSGHSGGGLLRSMTETGQAAGAGYPSEDSFSVPEEEDYREDSNSYNHHRSSPGYFSVSPRSGLTSRGKAPPEEYDTGSDSDVGDGEDAVDLSQKVMMGRGALNNNSDGIYNNNNNSNSRSYSRHHHQQNHTLGNSTTPGWSFKSLDSVSRKRKNRGLLENGREMSDREHAESNSSYESIADSVVTHATPSTPDQTRVANGRHHSEGNVSEQCHGEESTWHYLVPLLLLVLLAVFFGVVGMLYVNMHVPLLPTLSSVPAMVHEVVANLSVPFFTSSEVSSPVKQPSTSPSPSQSSERFPVCSDQLKNDCLSLEEVILVKPMLGLLDGVLLPGLQTWAGQYQCGQASTRHMPLADLAHLVHSHHNLMTWEKCETGLKALGRLVEWNPHWGLETVRQGQGEVIGLSLATHSTQILCHITTAIYSFFYLLIGIFTVILTAWLAYTCVRYYRERLKEEERQVCDLVDQIVMMVGARGTSGKGVVVQNVRDSIFLPRERVANKRLWDRAVSFIDRYESRVRWEVQSVDGEDREVWRWASSVPPPSSPSTSGAGAVQEGSNSRPLAKVWQGPAFNTQSPHNAPDVSPTSCLKIRNMFDCDVEFGDSWPARIQDSLLEKCEGVSVVHVAVDRASQEGCVYIKCGSLHDAGKAFRALHGWWYDGNLVTVKFLRDERYHQRFPSARHAHRPLKPSNNQRLSLQHPPATPHISPAPTHHLHSPVHS